MYHYNISVTVSPLEWSTIQQQGDVPSAREGAHLKYGALRMLHITFSLLSIYQTPVVFWTVKSTCMEELKVKLPELAQKDSSVFPLVILSSKEAVSPQSLFIRQWTVG